MTISPDFLTLQTRRALLMHSVTALGVIGVAGSSGVSEAQNSSRARGSVRIQISAMGQSAIGRVRGRIQISFDDLGLQYGAPIYLRFIKDQRRLEVWVRGPRDAFVRLRTYKVCGTISQIGPRQTARSIKQPEGFYSIDTASLRPQSVAYLGIDLNWPNAFDVAQGWRGPTSLVQAGCASEPHFGLTDQDMEEVYTLVHSALAGGQRAVPVHVFPFAMGRLAMMTTRRGANTSFWNQLAPAWQAFERTKKPPQVRVLGRRYVVSDS